MPARAAPLARGRGGLAAPCRAAVAGDASRRSAPPKQSKRAIASARSRLRGGDGRGAARFGFAFGFARRRVRFARFARWTIRSRAFGFAVPDSPLGRAFRCRVPVARIPRCAGDPLDAAASALLRSRERRVVAGGELHVDDEEGGDEQRDGRGRDRSGGCAAPGAPSPRAWPAPAGARLSRLLSLSVRVQGGVGRSWFAPLRVEGCVRSSVRRRRPARRRSSRRAQTQRVRAARGGRRSRPSPGTRSGRRRCPRRASARGRAPRRAR